MMFAGLSAPVSAEAAPKVRIEPQTLWAGCEYYMCVNLWNFPENGKKFNVPKGKDASAFFEVENKDHERLQYGVRFQR